MRSIKLQHNASFRATTFTVVALLICSIGFGQGERLVTPMPDKYINVLLNEFVSVAPFGQAANNPIPLRVYTTVTTDGTTVFWNDTVKNDKAKFLKFPVYNFSQTNAAFASKIETNYVNSAPTTFTIISLAKSFAMAAEQRMWMQNVSSTAQNLTAYLRATSPVITLITPTKTPIHNPTANTWQVVGAEMSGTDNNWYAIYNGLSASAYNVAKGAGSNAVQVSGIANYTSDLYWGGTYMWDRKLRGGEIDSMYHFSVIPEAGMIHLWLPSNPGSTLNYRNFDSYTGTATNWLNNGTNATIPPLVFDSTSNHILSAYPLIKGYTQRGVYDIAYKVDGTKGSHTSSYDIEHAFNSKNNRYNSYVDFNPNDSILTHPFYSLINKANYAVWDSAVRASAHYKANSNGDHTLWHNEEELTYEYMNAHLKPAYKNYIQFDYDAQGDSAIKQINAIKFFAEAAPVEDKITPDTVLMYSIYGNSIVNSLFSYITTLSAYTGMSEGDANKYVYAGADSTYPHILRWDGGMYVEPSVPHTYSWIPLDYRKNCYYTGTNNRVGVENIFGSELFDSIGRSKRIAIQTYNYNGTGFNDTTIQNWNIHCAIAGKDLYNISMKQYIVAKKYLENMGYIVRDMGIIMGGQAVPDIWSYESVGYTTAQMKTDITEFVTATRLIRPNVPIYYYEPTLSTDGNRAAFVTALTELQSTITKFYTFPILSHINLVDVSDDIHPDGRAQVMIGKALTGFIRSKEKLNP